MSEREPVSTTEPVSVFVCSCGYVESDPGSCCRNCGTKNSPIPMLAVLMPREEITRWSFREAWLLRGQKLNDADAEIARLRQALRDVGERLDQIERDRRERDKVHLGVAAARTILLTAIPNAGENR